MADLIRKQFPSQIKATQERVLEFAITTETKDRDGEIVKADGGQFDNYTKNPVVLWAHDYQSLPVGKTIKLSRKGTQTIASVEFPTKEEYEYADIVYKLCKGGYLNTVSIGFIPLEVENGKNAKDAARTYTKWELLEFSVVPVPSNPDALISARNAGVISVKEFDALNKPKREKEVSQDSIKDEIDYLKTLIDKVGLSDENKALVKTLIGGDMPIEIAKASAIRDHIAPVIKAIDAHHDAHMKWYAGCKAALDEICQSNDEIPTGEVPMNEPDADDKAASIEALKKEILQQLEVANA